MCRPNKCPGCPQPFGEGTGGRCWGRSHFPEGKYGQKCIEQRHSKKQWSIPRRFCVDSRTTEVGYSSSWNVHTNKVCCSEESLKADCKSNFHPSHNLWVPLVTQTVQQIFLWGNQIAQQNNSKVLVRVSTRR